MAVPRHLCQGGAVSLLPYLISYVRDVHFFLMILFNLNKIYQHKPQPQATDQL